MRHGRCDRRGSAAALGAPATRIDSTLAVHSAGRGYWLDCAHRRVGDPHRVPRGERTAGRSWTRTGDCGQLVATAVQAEEPDRAGRPGVAGVGAAPTQPGDRNHRADADVE